MTTTYPLNLLRRLPLAAVALTLLCTLGLVPAATAAEADPPVPATVNINSADAATLAAGLRGVGQSRAEAIVRYRETYGPFESVDELAEVKGVGQSTLKQNRELITLE